MEGNEYIYRMQPLVLPGAVYLLIYPIILNLAKVVFHIGTPFTTILWVLYGVTALAIVFIWLLARSMRITFDGEKIIIRNMLSTKVFEPATLRRATFFWTNKQGEVVKLRGHKHTFYLSDLYFPFNELMAELEQYLRYYNVRTNLAEHLQSR